MRTPILRRGSRLFALDEVRSRRRRVWMAVMAVAVVALLALLAATIVLRSADNNGRGLVDEATVTVSSTDLGSSARNATSGSVESPAAGWQSDGETAGAWIELSWPQAHVLRQIVIVRNPLEEPGITDGFLSFGDGSYVQLRLSGTSRQTTVPISPRSVDRFRFTASAVSAGAQSATVSEITVGTEPGAGDVVTDGPADGNVAPDAAVTQSGDASDPRAVQDGSGAPGAAGAGADWTVGNPKQAWIQLDWDRPRELSSIELVGSAGMAASVRSGTLTFGDGAQLPVGAVLPEPGRPTVLAFMPRVTRSVRLTIDQVDGAGPVVLAELRAYQRGATPAQSSPDAPPGPALPAGVSCEVPVAGAVQSGLVVRCPKAGSDVGGSVGLQVGVAPGFSTVSATVWPADAAAPVGASVDGPADASGSANLTIDVRDVPDGPFTVRVEAAGEGRDSSAVLLQLYRRGGGFGSNKIPPSTGATGRTLAYAEEFDRPVSRSRNGLGADYAAAKPTFDGAEDFGDAIFTDPASGVDTTQVVDNRYLRIGVEPSPPGFPDPQGWGRTHLGGLLASAREGGSGFSAQYGYFESRMLAPAAPGTWPAFWMLPSDSLIAPTPAVAEVDVVELYGHDPTGACHTTHEFVDGKDGGVARCGSRFLTERAAVAWHTYGVSVTPTGLSFFIDGQVVATAPQVEGGGAPMFFLVNLALGGGWPVDLRAVEDRAALYVDYVRVYV